MKVYIAGPMTGYVNHNFAAFEAAAKRLRALGYQVVNPAELDGDIPHEELREIPHEWFMRRDIELLVGCDAIYLLPGWAHSRGASLESTVARGCGLLEVTDPDVEIWRTFEGEPIEADEKVSEPECSVFEPPLPRGIACSELTCPSHGEANRREAETVALDTLARHDSYRKGDSFPNVAYVRDMTGLPAAHLAAWARDQMDGRGDQ